MTIIQRDNLRKKSKDDLIIQIGDFRRMYCFISEILIDVSKWHLTADEGIDKIREYLVENQELYKLV